jgi:ABC-2 type transport system permease protein
MAIKSTIDAAANPAARMAPLLAPRVIWVMWKREMLRYWRTRSQIFSGFSRTILWLIILGFGLGAALHEIEGYTYAQYIFPGVVTLNVLFTSVQVAIALVWDREVGILREVLVSPAPMLSVTFGKLLGGATVAMIAGTFPFIFVPLVGIPLTVPTFFLAWAVMFSMGLLFTAIGVIIASRMKTFEGFGGISNGVIQPLYFLSGSIFPLRGIIGGVGFLQIPDALRAQLLQYGIHTIGSGWVVILPIWLRVLVYANPVSYQLDTLRGVLLTFQQLPGTIDLAVTISLPLILVVFASMAMGKMGRAKG